MENETPIARRQFIRSTSLLVSAVCVGASPLLVFAEDKKNAVKIGVEEVSPAEDLMREHGGLNRILLVFEEAIRRIHAKEEFDPSQLKRSAQLIRDFIENYHEKLEEEFLFPSLKRAGRLVDTVDTLLIQHQAGRKLTDTILGLSTSAHFKNTSDREKLSSDLAKFTRMYRPHEAREDTVVFPEFKKLLTPKEYDKLGDQFEDKEHELFGKEGFEGVLVKIAEIEKAFGIADLSKFTPKD